VSSNCKQFVKDMCTVIAKIAPPHICSAPEPALSPSKAVVPFGANLGSDDWQLSTCDCRLPEPRNHISL
jgi:hypothetical protein